VTSVDTALGRDGPLIDTICMLSAKNIGNFTNNQIIYLIKRPVYIFSCRPSALFCSIIPGEKEEINDF
jgi:hypothetical protein